MTEKQKKFTREEVLEASTKYFNGDTLAANVFTDKYAARINDNTYLELTPDETHRRMAKEYARIEKKHGGEHQLSEDEIYELFKNFKYIVPGGSVMSGLGTNNGTIESLSNCFVLGRPGDSYASIMRYRDFMVEVEKRRGGAGLDLSNLRPEGTKVKNAAKTSTGPVSFMEGFSKLSEEVAQGGRRGALMISMHCNHPDIEKFIEVKQDLSKVTGANISVQFTDEFMDAVKNNKDYMLHWPIDTYPDFPAPFEYNVKYWSSDYTKCAMKVHARDIWNRFVECAWKTAEPGLMYVDRHHNMSPDGVYEEYRGVTTNPCGEIFMGKYDSCRLMHINLVNFVKEPGVFDFDHLEEVSYKNMQLCDDLVDLELEHVQGIIDHIKESYTEDNYNELRLWENIYKTGSSSRRAGCGATGLADAVSLMGYKMASEEGLNFIKKIFMTKMKGELRAQVDMAKERGTFVGYDFNKEFELVDNNQGNGMQTLVGKNEFFDRLANDVDVLPYEILDKMSRYGRRNVSWSTMAPVGTGAIMCQGTSGVEPLFQPYYNRRKKCNGNETPDIVDQNGVGFKVFTLVHEPFKQWIINNAPDYNKDVDFDVQATSEQLEKWFQMSPWFGNTSTDLTPKQHVDVQAAVQQYISHSISKTCILPENATKEDIDDIYRYGWETNCKGLTVYRDNCRNNILDTGKKDKDCNCKCHEILTHSAPKRPKTLPCDIKRFRNGGEKWIAFVGLYNGQPYEIFTGLAEKIDMPEQITTCDIVKNKVEKEMFNEETGKNEIMTVSSYDIVYTDKNGEKQTIPDVGNVFRTEFEGYSRLISGLLRTGMWPEYVVTTLRHIKFKNETISSWKSGVIRAIKSYIKDGEVQGETCPECGGKLVRENGCIHCIECGWSKCG